MKTKILTLIWAFAFTLTTSAQWSIDSVNTAGVYPFSGATNNKAVFTNGTEWNVFDALTNAHTWGSLSASRSMIQTVTYDEKIYFGGGKYGSFADPLYTNSIDVYNANNNTWSTLLLSKKREVGGAGATANKVVFAGGRGRQDISGPVYMYATADIFDAITGVRISGKLSKARTSIAVGSSGNKIVFAGGWFWDINYNTIYSNAVDIYDASANAWTKTTFSKGREGASVAVVSSKIIFAGGQGNFGPVTNVDIYDVVNDTWSTTNLPTARYGMKSAVIGSNAYFAGGYFDPTVNEINIYNTQLNSWTTVYIPVPLTDFSMSVINDKIYFAGGYISSSSSYSDLVQIYDPAMGTWTTEYLSIPRYAVSALTCVNKGYFAGGYTAYGYPIPVTTKRVDIRTTSSPIAEFIANVTTVIAGSTVNFTDQSMNNPTSWLWNFVGATPSTSIIQNPSGIQYNTPGTYDVSLTVTNGEGSNTITKFGYISVNPAPCITPTGLNSSDITTTTSTLNWNAVSGVNKYRVSWKISGNSPWTTTTTNTTSKIVTGLTPGTQYAWKVKSICGQGISSPFSPVQQFTTLAGKIFPVMPKAISIYPNPVVDKARISSSVQLQFPLNCSVYDTYGNLVEQFFLTEYQQEINVSRLPGGIYFIRVVDARSTLYEIKIAKN